LQHNFAEPAPPEDNQKARTSKRRAIVTAAIRRRSLPEKSLSSHRTGPPAVGAWKSLLAALRLRGRFYENEGAFAVSGPARAILATIRRSRRTRKNFLFFKKKLLLRCRSFGKM
jgi:hypothetical protein